MATPMVLKQVALSLILKGGFGSPELRETHRLPRLGVCMRITFLPSLKSWRKKGCDESLTSRDESIPEA